MAHDAGRPRGLQPWHLPNLGSKQYFEMNGLRGGNCGRYLDIAPTISRSYRREVMGKATQPAPGPISASRAFNKKPSLKWDVGMRAQLDVCKAYMGATRAWSGWIRHYNRVECTGNPQRGR